MGFPEESAFSISLYNPIFSPSSSDAGLNLIINPGFESAFASWTQDTDSGNVTITQEQTTPDPNSGTDYCQMYSVNGGDVAGNVNQAVTVESEQKYRISFWSRTSDIFATMQGRVAVYDVSNSSWIISREQTGLFASTEWQDSSLFFIAPVGCTSVRLYLYQNIDSDSYVYYDDISLKLVPPGGLSFVAEYNNMVNSYSHTITTNLGFDSMRFQSAGDLPFMEEWLENGLGRHIVVTEPGSGTIWEGFVNSVKMTVGSFTMSVGPLTSIMNRIRIAYNTIDWNTTPPVGGDSVNSQWRDDLLSIGRYGIQEGIISGGEGTAEEMYSLMKTLMPEVAWPSSDSNFRLGGSASVAINVECLGYGHLLDKYYYSQVSIAGEQNASDKVKDVINRNPNNIFRYSDSSIFENTSQVPVYEDGSKTGLAILKEIAAVGDASDTRNVFAVYEGGLVSYGPIGTKVSFITRLEDGRIEHASGGYASPWAVRPTAWLLISDAFIGRATNFIRPSEDPRMIFIESVSYTAPYGLNITGGRASTFRQKIERLGLGGI